jgi:hypothetical protein
MRRIMLWNWHLKTIVKLIRGWDEIKVNLKGTSKDQASLTNKW